MAQCNTTCVASWIIITLFDQTFIFPSFLSLKKTVNAIKLSKFITVTSGSTVTVAPCRPLKEPDSEVQYRSGNEGSQLFSRNTDNNLNVNY